MNLEANVIDIWVFRRGGAGGAEVEYLLLHTSQAKAERYFGGGRFWQIPSGVVEGDEPVEAAIARILGGLGVTTAGIWAAEHVYTIYNRRFACMQIIAVFAAELAPPADAAIRLDPAEHAEHRWCTFDEALARVHYRGLKDGLRSTVEYVTGPAGARRELRLR